MEVKRGFGITLREQQDLLLMGGGVPVFSKTEDPGFLVGRKQIFVFKCEEMKNGLIV